jgi:hypothetical protein
VLITVEVGCGAVVLVVLAVAAVLAGAARRTASVTLTGPIAVRGDWFWVDGRERVVVRRVLRDITRSHVVLVRPWRWWHRWRWTRGWL